MLTRSKYKTKPIRVESPNHRIPGDSNLLNLEEKDDELQKEFGQSLMENVAKMKKENSSSGTKKIQSVGGDFPVKNMLFGDWQRVNKHSGKYSVGTVEKVDLIDEDNEISDTTSAEFVQKIKYSLLLNTTPSPVAFKGTFTFI